MDSPRNNIFGNFGKKSSPGGFFCQQEPQVFCNNVDVSNMVFQPTEEVRVPNFIKKLRMLNAVYPNFSHPHTNYDLENGKLQNIVLEANKSLLYVESMMKKIRKIERKRK